MNSFFNLTSIQQRQIFDQTAIAKGLPPQAVEKDLWVTVILQLVFTLKDSEKLVFKGGTSLSKVWGLISRFSEDIDLAVDRSLFGQEGDLTVKQLKKLRKESSMFVSGVFNKSLCVAINENGLNKYLTVIPQPAGEGDKTYPEPRQIYIKYRSVYETLLDYINPQVTLEIGARSLIEPAAEAKVTSFVSEVYSAIDTRIADSIIYTAVPQKTFLEKAFLLHELFSTDGCSRANRKSRHLYDLEKMMDTKECIAAISDDELWNAIHHHRDVFTHISGVDYTPDIRDRIILTPPEKYMAEWKNDYEEMRGSMILGTILDFDSLIARMIELQQRFRQRLLK
jgi:hypothetical protein